MASKPGHVTLNFNPILLARIRDYAAAHGKKLNAILKEAFELLEDVRPLKSKQPKDALGYDDAK